MRSWQERSTVLQNILQVAVADDVWIEAIECCAGAVRASLHASENTECVLEIVRVLLDYDLVVPLMLEDGEGHLRVWPGSLSAAEVCALLREAEKRIGERWLFSAVFATTELGARLGIESGFVTASYDEFEIDLEDLAGSLDAEGVRFEVGEWPVCGDQGIRAIGEAAEFNSLFEKVSAHGQPYMPGDHYLGDLFRLRDGTVLGRRRWAWDRSFIDIRYPDRSFDKCMTRITGPNDGTALGRSVPLPPDMVHTLSLAAKVGSTMEGIRTSSVEVSTLAGEVLVRGLQDYVSLAEVDGLLAAGEVGVCDVPEAVFSLVRELLENKLALVGSVRGGRVVAYQRGFMPWALSPDDTIARMRVERLVLGDAWVWTAWFCLTEAGAMVANDLGRTATSG